jgi:predicted AAA+ superfamily ATPase
VGGLFENYLFIERIKKQHYLRMFSNNYFWRTYDGKEVDLVEEREGRLFGYEFKWTGKGARPPKRFLDAYPNARVEIISRENMLDFIS